MHSYKGHNKKRKCATRSMAQNGDACLLKIKRAVLEHPSTVITVTRKQMEICHGPFKNISFENRGTVSETASDGHTASALLGLGSTTISVRQSTGTVINDRCSSDSPLCHAVCMHGSTLKISTKSKIDSVHQIR